MDNPLFGHFEEVTKSLVRPSAKTPRVQPPSSKSPLKTFVDLFCGVGGFHLAASALGLKCLFACDNDADARAVYQQNFGIKPEGDIIGIEAKEIPDHDLLCAGFPCQPYSIIGNREGFRERRGFLFLEIARVIAEKRPQAVILENVKQLATAEGGKVLQYILNTLDLFGYAVTWRILNALDYGVPQKRERVLIVASLSPLEAFSWPDPVPMPPLSTILETTINPRHLVSSRIRKLRHQKHTPSVTPSIWHENKGGNISSHPFSCALRAGASYNYLLVNGERRLTPREMFRLQGFPDTFMLSDADSQARRQAGNAVPVPMITATLKCLVHALRPAKATR